MLSAFSLNDKTKQSTDNRDTIARENRSTKVRVEQYTILQERLIQVRHNRAEPSVCVNCVRAYIYLCVHVSVFACMRACLCVKYGSHENVTRHIINATLKTGYPCYSPRLSLFINKIM